MDQRTRRRFIQTIETFFPRELCGEMEGYPTFQTSLQKRDSGLNSDFVCGPLKDAVDSGEHIVRCVQMPHLGIQCTRTAPTGNTTTVKIILGFWFMTTNKNRIVIYNPGEVYGRSGYGTSWEEKRGPTWEFINSTFEDIDGKLFDTMTKDHIRKWGQGGMNGLSINRAPLGSGSKIWGFILPNDVPDFQRSAKPLIDLASSQTFIQTYLSISHLMNSITPQQQRVFRQRQRVVRQSSDRIERSMVKIRDEFGRLETEMKKLGDLSSTLSTQRTFTIGQDGQFVSQPT